MSEKKLDPCPIQVVDHLIIRDKDSGKILVNKRDVSFEPNRILKDNE